MKKIFIIMAIAAIAGQQVHAQKSSIGFTAGATLAKVSAKFEGGSFTSDSKIGFTAGVTGNIPMGRQLSFQPAINYVQKGGKSKSDSYESSTRLNYIEIPLNVVYQTQGASGHLFVGAGPSFSLGISGRTKDNDPIEPIDEKIHFGTKETDIAKPFEIGANVLLGYQFKNGFTIAANYNKGLNNISPDATTKDHNTYFGLRFGIMLSGKKG